MYGNVPNVPSSGLWASPSTLTEPTRTGLKSNGVFSSADTMRDLGGAVRSRPSPYRYEDRLAISRIRERCSAGKRDCRLSYDRLVSENSRRYIGWRSCTVVCPAAGTDDCLRRQMLLADGPQDARAGLMARIVESIVYHGLAERSMFGCSTLVRYRMGESSRALLLGGGLERREVGGRSGQPF